MHSLFFALGFFCSLSVSAGRLLQNSCDDEPLDVFSVRGTYLCSCESGPETTCEHRCNVCNPGGDVCYSTEVTYSINPIASIGFRRSVITWQFNQGLEGNVTLVTDYVDVVGKTCSVAINGDEELCSCIQNEEEQCFIVSCNQGSSTVGGTTYDGCLGIFEGSPIPLLLETPMFSSNFTFQNCQTASPTLAPTASPTRSGFEIACEETEQNVENYVTSDYDCTCSVFGNSNMVECSQVCKECFVNEAGPTCAIRANLRIEFNSVTSTEKSYRTEVHYLEGQHKDKVVVVSKQFESNICTASIGFGSCISCEIFPTADGDTCMILNCTNLQGEGVYNECTAEFDGTGGALVYAAFGRPALRPDLPSQHQAINRQSVCSTDNAFPTTAVTMNPTVAPSTFHVAADSSDSDSQVELAALSVLAIIPIAAFGYWWWKRRHLETGRHQQKEDPPELGPNNSEEAMSEQLQNEGGGSPPTNFLPANKDQCQTVVAEAAAMPQQVPEYLPEHKDQCRYVVPPGLPMAEAVPMVDEADTKEALHNLEEYEI